MLISERSGTENAQQNHCIFARNANAYGIRAQPGFALWQVQVSAWPNIVQHDVAHVCIVCNTMCMLGPCIGHQTQTVYQSNPLIKSTMHGVDCDNDVCWRCCSHRLLSYPGVAGVVCVTCVHVCTYARLYNIGCVYAQL